MNQKTKGMGNNTKHPVQQTFYPNR